MQTYSQVFFFNPVKSYNQSTIWRLRRLKIEQLSELLCITVQCWRLRRGGDLFSFSLQKPWTEENPHQHCPRLLHLPPLHPHWADRSLKLGRSSGRRRRAMSTLWLWFGPSLRSSSGWTCGLCSCCQCRLQVKNIFLFLLDFNTWDNFTLFFFLIKWLYVYM